MSTNTSTPEQQLAVVKRAIEKCRPLLQHLPDSQKIIDLMELGKNPHSIKGKIDPPLSTGTQLFTVTAVNGFHYEPESANRGELYEMVLDTNGKLAVWARTPLEGIDDAYRHSFRTLSGKELIYLLEVNPNLAQALVNKLGELLHKSVVSLQDLLLEHDEASTDIEEIGAELKTTPPLAA